jgi:hypothetical protein
VFPCFHEVVSTVPEHDCYLTLDALEASSDRFAAAHREVGLWQAGASRAGHPIRCLEVPGGPLQALLVGAPHPEEPVGTLVLEHLLPLLADGLAEELGFGFSVVKVGDPDAMRLNEPWFAEPYDLAGFLLRAYRPPLADQFEWTFPVEYKRYGFTRPLSEARAVMEVVHRGPLDLFMSLHNSYFSGAYFYVSAEDEALQLQFAAIMAAAGLPPHCGEPEVPYLRTLADGVFRSFALADDYDYYAAYGADPAVLFTSGTSSDAYAESVWDCFTLVAEVPYFTSSRIADKSPAGLTRGEAKLRGLEVQQQLAAWLLDLYVEAAPHLTGETPWQRTVHAWLTSIKDDIRAERTQIETEPEFGAEATVAQLFDSLYLRELDALSRVGQFANMLAAEPEQSDVLTGLRARAEARVRERAPQLASAGGLEPVPIRSLVQCQLAALLCSLVAVRERYRPAHPRPPAPRIALS